MAVGVVVDGEWSFFHEVFSELEQHHQTRLFERPYINLPVFADRINRYLFNRDLKDFLRSSQVVFFEWAAGLLESASKLGRLCPIVTRIHRYEMYKWADLITWAAVDRIIVVSNAKRAEFVRRFPDQENKVRVIPEAIRLDRFRYQPKEFNGNIGTLCHLSARKRVYDLILAFSELAHQEKGLRLHLGGEPRPAYMDYYEALRRLVRELRLEDRVTFHGRITKPEEWYAHVDIFISNSYSEGLQVAPMEAIASGCYCLSHRWDGADELLPEDALYMTGHELISRIQTYCSISERERRERIDRLYNDVRERFDVKKTGIQIRQVVEEAAGHRGGTAI